MVTNCRRGVSTIEGGGGAGGGGGGSNTVLSTESSSSTIFSEPRVGTHGKRPGGLADQMAKEDEDLRDALEHDTVGRVKMLCMAHDKDTPEYEEVRVTCLVTSSCVVDSRECLHAPV